MIVNVSADEIVYGNQYVQYNTTADSFISRDDQFCNILDCYALSELITWTVTEDVNFNGYELTAVGELVMQGLITSRDIIPYTTDLYSLGNSTHWFDELYVRTLYANDIFTTNLNASNINTTDMNSKTIDVENNMTLGNHIFKSEGQNLIIVLDD